MPVIDPNDDDIENTDEDYEDDGHFFGDEWIDTYEDDMPLEGFDGECNMCGRERFLNDEGYCSFCWQVWNS